MNNQKRNTQILISCDCRGNIEEIVKKVTSLTAQKSFDFMILAGQVCHPKSSSFIQLIRNHTITIPLPIYFLDESQMSPILHKLHPKGLQICQNFNFLGSHGIINVQGINIAYFSHNNQWKNKNPQSSDIQSFLNICRGKTIDILITNKWSNQAKYISGKQKVNCANFISNLASSINPHYHIAAGSDSFYRMAPYVNNDNCLTHFISVAPYQENTKQKYIFGLTLKAGLKQSAQGDNILQNIYSNLRQNQQNIQKNNGQLTLKSKINQKEKEKQVKINNSGQYSIFFEGFPDWAKNSDITQFLQRFGDIKTIQCKKQLSKGHRCGYIKYQDPLSMQSCLQSSQKIMLTSKRIKFTRVQQYFSKKNLDCWFCKARQDKQLTIYLGKYCCISLQKGPINKFHMQIIPDKHIQNTGRLQIAQRQQIDNILITIKNHFMNLGYQIIVYQRYLPLSQSINHCVLHFIPFKSQNHNPIFLQSKFQKLNINNSLGFKIDRGERRSTQHYIKLNFNNSYFIKQISKKQRVQADYMRVVIGQLIENPKIANWKQCQRSQTQLSKQRKQIMIILKQCSLIE